MVTLQNVTKTYRTGSEDVAVLKGVSLEIAEGEMVAIMGPSGSGKSTLMNLIGLLDRPTSGVLSLGGTEVSLSMSDRVLAKLRAETIGFVFQSFQLLPRSSALSNVLTPAQYHPRPGSKDRAAQLLERLGLGKRLHHLPTELSGGEKQRVAIARALFNDPKMILADEPTGNLDSRSGGEVLDVLSELNSEGKTVIIITHDQAVADRCQRTIRLKDGEIV